MQKKELHEYAECIWCWSNNILDILLEYIKKYDDEEILKEHNLKKEDLLWSIRFLLQNLEDNRDYHKILMTAIDEWYPEVIETLLSFAYPITEEEAEEVRDKAKHHAKKKKKKRHEEVFKIVDKHTFKISRRMI